MLGNGRPGVGHLKGQQYRKLASLPFDAADLDAAMMLFHDSAGQRKPEASAVSLGGEKRAEDIGQISRRDTAAGVADVDGRELASRTEVDTHGAWSIRRLNGIEQQVQKHLVNLIAIVFDFGQIGRVLEFDRDRLGEDLLARQHHGVFRGRVEVAAANLRRVRTRRFEQIGQDAVDLRDLEANIFDYRSRRAGRGQIAADDFHDTGDAG